MPESVTYDAVHIGELDDARVAAGPQRELREHADSMARGLAALRRTRRSQFVIHRFPMPPRRPRARLVWST